VSLLIVYNKLGEFSHLAPLSLWVAVVVTLLSGSSTSGATAGRSSARSRRAGRATRDRPALDRAAAAGRGPQAARRSRRHAVALRRGARRRVAARVRSRRAPSPPQARPGGANLPRDDRGVRQRRLPGGRGAHPRGRAARSLRGIRGAARREDGGERAVHGRRAPTRRARGPGARVPAALDPLPRRAGARPPRRAARFRRDRAPGAGAAPAARDPLGGRGARPDEARSARRGWGLRRPDRRLGAGRWRSTGRADDISRATIGCCWCSDSRRARHRISSSIAG
jgi:hypothetical protein